MRRAIHLAALRMASKVALSGSVISCSASNAPAINATPSTEATPDTGIKSAPPPKKSCETTINEAFPKEGDYPGKKQDVSGEVVACCRAELLEHMSMAKHRWDCCANVSKDDNKLHAACTPWGPPMPPAMAEEVMMPAGVLDLRGCAATISVPVIEPLVEAAIETWRGRMINEYASARVFAALAEQLTEAGIDAREVFGFADEERRHGALCGAVVESLGGEAIGQLPAFPEFPLHADAHTPLEAALRNVLSVCCLSETVAVALIGAERLEMPDSELRDLLTEIWSDEVGHARFGWRLLASLALDEGTRARLADYLVVAFEHLVEHELAHLPVSSRPPPEGAAYGLCDGASARRLFFDTVETVIIPGLEAHGIDARTAWSGTIALRSSFSSARIANTTMSAPAA